VDETIKILILAGSLRRDAYNRALARAAAQVAPRGLAMATFDGLGTLPFYDRDVEDGLSCIDCLADRRRITDGARACRHTLFATGGSRDVRIASSRSAPRGRSSGPGRCLCGEPHRAEGLPGGPFGMPAEGSREGPDGHARRLAPGAGRGERPNRRGPATGAPGGPRTRRHNNRDGSRSHASEAISSADSAAPSNGYGGRQSRLLRRPIGGAD
jgi:hypothetical protein